MRRIRHLEQCDYIIPIRQKLGGQLVALNGQSNCYLERTGDKKTSRDFSLSIHAKFNSDSFDGLNIQAGLVRNGKFFESFIDLITISRVEDGSFDSTVVVSVSPTKDGLRWISDVPQSLLSPNELSGAETYLIEVEAFRGSKSYKSFVYFNHMGVFDTVDRLKKKIEFLEITKLDE